MHLGREVAVQRADRDVGTVGHGAHLHCLVAALRRDRHGGVENAFAALALRFGAEFRFGQYRHRQDLPRLGAGTLIRAVSAGFPIC